MNETRTLAEFAAGTAYSDLPAEVVEAVRVYILDNLASGFVGASTPWAGMAGALARESAPNGACSVFGAGWTTSPSYASLVNGVMIGGFETDHAYFAGSCHPSAAVFPAALALAERDGIDGKGFITAVAMGYEVTCRVGMAATRAVEDQAGFHGPGTNASFGGAAAAAKLLGLDAQGVSNALGIAGSHAGGLLEFSKEGAMTKRLHVGRGCQMGLEAGILAASGFTGPSTVLEGEKGFLKVYSPEPQPHLLVEGLGSRYILMDMTVKAYACHASFHPIIDGIHKFVAEQGPKVETLRIAGTKRMVDRHGQREPETVLGAQYSLPFSAAVAVCRDIADPSVYNDDTLWDAAVRDLAKKVELSDDGRFGQPGGPVGEVTATVDGVAHTFQAKDWKGAPGNPYSYDDMADKFRRYAAPVISDAQAQRIVDAVGSLESLDDVGTLARLIRSE